VADEVEWLTSSLGRSTLRKELRFPYYRRLGGAQCRPELIG